MVVSISHIIIEPEVKFGDMMKAVFVNIFVGVILTFLISSLGVFLQAWEY